MQFIKDNVFMIGLALASAAMLLWPLVSRQFAGGKQVDTLEAVQNQSRRRACTGCSRAS
jgi:hypothetical protein